MNRNLVGTQGTYAQFYYSLIINCDNKSICIILLNNKFDIHKHAIHTNPPNPQITKHLNIIPVLKI